MTFKSRQSKGVSCRTPFLSSHINMTIFSLAALFITSSLFGFYFVYSPWRWVWLILVAIAVIFLIKAYRLSKRVISTLEEHTSELQSRPHLVCRLLLEKKKK